MLAISDSVPERFVAALKERDLRAAMALYVPDARFEAHVPGWDVLVDQPAEIGALLDDFLIGRDAFRVLRYQIVREGETAALRCDLQWRDAEDGAPCRCYQSHFFDLAGEQICFHTMYCAGVRVQRPEAVAQPA